jgi:hypothetical protein
VASPIVEEAVLSYKDGREARYARRKGRRLFDSLPTKPSRPVLSHNRRWFEERPQTDQTCSGVTFQKASEVEAGGESGDACVECGSPRNFQHGPGCTRPGGAVLAEDCLPDTGQPEAWVGYVIEDLGCIDRAGLAHRFVVEAVDEKDGRPTLAGEGSWAYFDDVRCIASKAQVVAERADSSKRGKS